VLVEERQREAGGLAVLRAERATVSAKGRQIEREAAPIRYVAALFGVAELQQIFSIDHLLSGTAAINSTRVTRQAELMRLRTGLISPTGWNM
jgi:hypothetical protein